MKYLVSKLWRSLSINPKNQESWQIAVARFCVDNSEKGFEFKDLKDFVHLNYTVSDSHLEFFIQEEIQQPAGRQFGRSHDKGTWIPPLDLVSKINDYDELKDARKNARNAFWLSLIAIIITITVGAIQLFKIQEVSVTNDFIKTEITNNLDVIDRNQ